MLNQNTKLFIHENADEYIVCEMAAILSRGDEFKHHKMPTFSYPTQNNSHEDDRQTNGHNGRQ